MVGRSVGWLVGRLVGWLAGWLVGWLVVIVVIIIIIIFFCLLCGNFVPLTRRADAHQVLCGGPHQLRGDGREIRLPNITVHGHNLIARHLLLRHTMQRCMTGVSSQWQAIARREGSEMRMRGGDVPYRQRQLLKGGLLGERRTVQREEVGQLLAEGNALLLRSTRRGFRLHPLLRNKKEEGKEQKRKREIFKKEKRNRI